jgi:hypothetical protein
VGLSVFCVVLRLVPVEPVRFLDMLASVSPPRAGYAEEPIYEVSRMDDPKIELGPTKPDSEESAVELCARDATRIGS